jgi:hypothetical protein
MYLAGHRQIPERVATTLAMAEMFGVAVTAVFKVTIFLWLNNNIMTFI